MELHMSLLRCAKSECCPPEISALKVQFSVEIDFATAYARGAEMLRFVCRAIFLAVGARAFAHA